MRHVPGCLQNRTDHIMPFCNNYVKTVKAEFELPNFCTSSDDALYLYKVL